MKYESEKTCKKNISLTPANRPKISKIAIEYRCMQYFVGLTFLLFSPRQTPYGDEKTQKVINSRTTMKFHQMTEQ